VNISHRSDLCKNVSLRCYLVATVIHIQPVHRYVYAYTYCSRQRLWSGKRNTKIGTAVNAVCHFGHANRTFDSPGLYSIPPSTFHPSTLFKHGGKSLNGWYEVSSVTVCPYAFVNANRGEILLHWKFSRGISRLPGTNFEKPSCNIYPIKLSCTFSASCSQSPKSEGQTASAVVLFARTLRF